MGARYDRRRWRNGVVRLAGSLCSDLRHFLFLAHSAAAETTEAAEGVVGVIEKRRQSHYSLWDLGNGHQFGQGHRDAANSGQYEDQDATRTYCAPPWGRRGVDRKSVV